MRYRWLMYLLFAASFLLASVTPMLAQKTSPAVTQPAVHFDVEAATNAYLNSVPMDQRARSNAYFEGGYWMILWDFLYAAAVCIFLLTTGISARMRNVAQRLTRFKPIQTAVYWVEFFSTFTLLTYPINAYETFCRERKYGLMNQTFSAWFLDDLKNDLVNLVLGAILMAVLFGIVRKLPRTWWIWGTAASILFLIFVVLIAPVYIAPLFNKYTKLEDARVREPILSMARANGIPVTDVWVMDSSRQSKRVSANVSGLLGTERITLNDNLLSRCTLPEIEAVMGHEMGHYVMNHLYKAILFMSVMALLFFGYLRWSLEWSLARWGKQWDIHGVGDLAVLPLAILLASFFFFVMTPVNNSWTRTQEFEADMFGLNAAGQPDGEAKVDLLLGEYRKLDPSRLEEIIFFDHPSGRTRINAAMTWKAEHLK